jgi:putative transposase
VARSLVRRYDTRSHEEVQTAHLLKNHLLAKSLAHAGWRACLGILAFQAACAGKRAVAVPPADTSQMCSGCGVVVHTGLSVRWHACPECGTRLQRDHNAAKTLEWAGQARRGAVA